MCKSLILFLIFHFICLFKKKVVKMWRKKILLSIFLFLRICFHYPPCPPISLVACSSAAATTAQSTVVAFQSWCDGWRGDWWLRARPLVKRAPPSVETEPSVWWHLAFYCKNYASVLTFSLMHKIHDVCGTSCRHCSRKTGEEYVTAEAQQSHVLRIDLCCAFAYVRMDE